MGVEPVTENTPKSFTDLFNEVFPYFLSIGMSYEQFWYKEPELVLAYLEVDRIKRKRTNADLHAQGIYFLAALNSALSHSFGGKGSEPIDYPTEPFPIDQKEARERQIEKCKQAANNFAALARAKNEKRAKREDKG